MRVRDVSIWSAVALAVAGPILVAAQSPLLAWRDTTYIIASFAGIIGLALLLVQPLLIAGILSGVAPRRVHTWGGGLLIIAVTVHVVGLWITSPPDVIDVLLFRSPTPFSVWGMLALCAVFAAAILAIFRKRIGARGWRLGHTVATSTVVIATVLHAWFVQGTMGSISKAALFLAILLAGVLALRQRRVWRLLR